MRDQSPVPTWWQVAAMATGLAVLSAGPLRAGVTEHTFVASSDTTEPQTAIRGFLNPSPITIPASGPASLYPSPITVADVPGTVWDVGLQIRVLSHTFPDDLDFMLVSPPGDAGRVHVRRGGEYTGLERQGSHPGRVLQFRCSLRPR
jgi:hypothetical protein